MGTPEGGGVAGPGDGAEKPPPLQEPGEVTQARGGRTPSLRGEGAFPGASAAVGGTRVSLNCCGVRAACPGSRPRSPSPCGAAAEPAVPGYRGLRRRGAGRGRPLLRGDRGRRGSGPGPGPVPPIRPCVRGKAAAGQAGEDGSAVRNLLWGDSPGAAPGKPRTPSAPPALWTAAPRQEYRGRGGRAPDGILHLMPGDTAGFGSALAARGAVISAVQDRQEAPGRAAEAGRLPGPGAEASPQPPPRDTLSAKARRGVLLSSSKTTN